MVAAGVIVVLFLIVGQVWASSIQSDWKANEDSSTSAPQQTVSAEWAIKDASITQVRLVSFLCAMIGAIAVLFFAMARQLNDPKVQGIGGAGSASPPPGPAPSSAAGSVARAPNQSDAAGTIDRGRIAQAFPRSYEQAVEQFNALPERPANPEAWLEELCRRISAGSPPAAAASRIPLTYPDA